MKSFLDRLRRKGTDEGDPKKAESPDEREQEAAKEGSSSGKVPVGEPVPAKKTPARETPSTPLREETATFVLGDFLKRIPEQLLAKGPHDETLPLTFDVSDLSSRIARGQTTLSLVEIYKRAPHLFPAEIRETDNIEIRFPWQKLLELVKAAESASPRAGLSESAAESLAQRLRSRKGSPGDAGSPAEEKIPFVSPSAQQSERSPMIAFGQSRELATAASEVQPQQTSGRELLADRDAATLEVGRTKGDYERRLIALQQERQTLVEQRDRAMAELERMLKEINEVRDQVESQKNLAAKTMENATRAASGRASAQEQLDAQRAAAERHVEEIAALRAELEQYRKGTGGQASRQAGHEVSRAGLQAELEMQRGALAERARELAALREQFDQAKSVAVAKTVLEKELETHRAALEESARVLAALRDEVGELQRGTEGKVASLVQERDALVQQKTHLTKQVEQFQKSVNAPTDASSTDGDRSRRENQRQVDELQRRISALESSQKESAQELGRERETRIKAERAATAAERARGEATALAESIRTDLRREADGVIRKRDAEFARVQRELGERIEALTDAQRKAVSERDELTAEVAMLKKAAQEAEADATRAVHTNWESRTVASLEADVENYRGRIKALIKEHDALAKEKEQLAAKSVAPEEAARLKETSEKLAADLASAQAERQRVTEQLQQVAEQLAHADSGNAIAMAAHERRSAAELNRLQSELAALRTQHEALAAEHRSGLARIEEMTAQLAARPAGPPPEVLVRVEQLQSKLASLRTKSAKELKAAAAERDRAREQLANVTAEIDSLKARADVAAAADAALREVRQ
jgi:chromosome segregation ATPase